MICRVFQSPYFCQLWQNYSQTAISYWLQPIGIGLVCTSELHAEASVEGKVPPHMDGVIHFQADVEGKAGTF
jgi:hypothetical protein